MWLGVTVARPHTFHFIKSLGPILNQRDGVKSLTDNGTNLIAVHHCALWLRARRASGPICVVYARKVFSGD